MPQAMTRREFVKAAAATMPAAYLSGQLQAQERSVPRRPNIVYLFADQMRACAMGAMGNTQVHTPHMDKLAAEGVLVTNCISSQPVCTPYRGQLLTGRYGCTTGVMKNDQRLPDDLTVLPTAMKAAGYNTGYIGKWHLAGNRKNPVDQTNRRDWDLWAVRNCSHRHFNPQYWLNDATEPIEVDGWEPDVQTDVAIEFIKQHKHAPFCLAVSYGPPHNPYKAPKKYLDRYDKPIRFRPNTIGSERWADAIRHYYAMVTSLDDCLGRIAKALADANLAQDTVLIFTSDHGDMLGAQGMKLKQKPWEESSHVPLVMRYPRRIKAGQKRDWLIDSVDMMPTMLGLAGANIPAGVQGIDQSDVLLGGDEKRQSCLMLSAGTGSNSAGVDWRAIRTKDWLYAMHHDGDWLLYDLANDPYQLKNLVDNPQHAERKAQLRNELIALRKAAKDDLPLATGKPIPLRLPV